MDALQVDVTDITEVQPYDWVTLIGTDRGEHISVASLARDAGITPYQLMRRLQCKHSYIDNGNSMTAELVDPRKHT